MFTAVVLSLFVQAADPYPVDYGLIAQVMLQARAVGITANIIVRVPPSWQERGYVNAKTNVRDDVIVITVSPILLDDLDADAQNAMFAHELAHSQNECGPFYANDAERDACEHAADALAATWVGRQSMIRSLCQLMASSWRWKYSADFAAMIGRIKYLHERTDIP
ncbi:MAG TPA: hypothetical protein VMU12_00750 [Candidatus Paceibacterota bacterium]|nr:hypothetical protein [Candidatus Paceibacterota bacterium]